MNVLGSKRNTKRDKEGGGQKERMKERGREQSGLEGEREQAKIEQIICQNTYVAYAFIHITFNIRNKYVNLCYQQILIR